MLVKFRCPKCRAQISLTDDQLRNFLVCQHCGQKLRVPEHPLAEGNDGALKAKEELASGFSYRVEFKPAPVRTAAAALKLASAAETYAAPSEPDGVHQVSYKPWAAGQMLELVNLLAGSECRTFFNDQEVPFYELRSSLACLRLRYSARNRDSYCRGGGGWPGAIFLCHRSGLSNDGPQPWLYRFCLKGNDGKFYLDRDGFASMVAERLSEYRYCPFAAADFVAEAVTRLQESIEAGTAGGSLFLHPEFHAALPDLRRQNSSRDTLYQRVYAFTNHCLQCAVHHGVVHDGTGLGVPLLPVHHACHCLDLPVAPGESSLGYRGFSTVLPLLSEEEQAALVGGEMAALIRVGFPPESALDGAVVRGIDDVARRLNIFAVEALADDRELVDMLRRIKGEKGVGRDEKQWLRAVAKARRSHDESEAENAAARELISQAARRIRK